MSRGYEGRSVAWQCWLHFYTRDGRVPVAYEHQCGVLGLVCQRDLGDMVCPGCRHELAHPETECQPLYGPNGAA